MSCIPRIRRWARGLAGLPAHCGQRAKQRPPHSLTGR